MKQGRLCRLKLSCTGNNTSSNGNGVGSGGTGARPPSRPNTGNGGHDDMDNNRNNAGADSDQGGSGTGPGSDNGVDDDDRNNSRKDGDNGNGNGPRQRTGVSPRYPGSSVGYGDLINGPSHGAAGRWGAADADSSGCVSFTLGPLPATLANIAAWSRRPGTMRASAVGYPPHRWWCAIGPPIAVHNNSATCPGNVTAWYISPDVGGTSLADSGESSISPSLSSVVLASVELVLSSESERVLLSDPVSFQHTLLQQIADGLGQNPKRFQIRQFNITHSMHTMAAHDHAAPNPANMHITRRQRSMQHGTKPASTSFSARPPAAATAAVTCDCTSVRAVVAILFPSSLSHSDGFDAFAVTSSSSLLSILSSLPVTSLWQSPIHAHRAVITAAGVEERQSSGEDSNAERGNEGGATHASSDSSQSSSHTVLTAVAVLLILCILAAAVVIAHRRRGKRRQLGSIQEKKTGGMHSAEQVVGQSTTGMATSASSASPADCPELTRAVSVTLPSSPIDVDVYFYTDSQPDSKVHGSSMEKSDFAASSSS